MYIKSGNKRWGNKCSGNEIVGPNSQACSSYQAYTLYREHAFIALTGNTHGSDSSAILLLYSRPGDSLRALEILRQKYWKTGKVPKLKKTSSANKTSKGMSDSHRHREVFDPEEINLEGNPEEGDREEGNPEEGDPEEGNPEEGHHEANPKDDDVWQLSQIYKKRAYRKGREASSKYLHM
jgi:hypothetical protein